LPLLVAEHTVSGATVGNADLVTLDGSGAPGLDETITDSHGNTLTSDVVDQLNCGLCFALFGPCTNTC
jgi:hypothetical protein